MDVMWRLSLKRSSSHFPVAASNWWFAVSAFWRRSASTFAGKSIGIVCAMVIYCSAAVRSVSLAAFIAVIQFLRVSRSWRILPRRVLALSIVWML